MELPATVPAKGYPRSLLEPLAMLARRLREKSETLPGHWVEETDEGLRTGRIGGLISPPTGEVGGLLFLTLRGDRLFGHFYLTEHGTAAREGLALIRAFLALRTPEIRRVDLTVSASSSEGEKGLAALFPAEEFPFRVVERQRMVRDLDARTPPDPPVLPAGLVLGWVPDFATPAIAELDFRAFEESPDRGLVAETPQEALRLMEEMLRGDLGPLIREGSPCIAPEADPERPVAFLLSLQQGATGALIADVAVAPELRRKGVGRALLARALRGLLARGMERASLWVTCANTSACRLYEEAGFTVAQREPIFIWERPSP